MEKKVSLKLSVCGRDKKVKGEISGENRVELIFKRSFETGDYIKVESSVYPTGLTIRFEQKLPEANIWLDAPVMEYPVPFGDELKAYPPNAFCSSEQLLSAAVTGTELFQRYRNLSENPLDRRGISTCYPHCTATAESDNGDPRFAARNSIDGVIVPAGHVIWPYTSWGDAEDHTAEIKIEFGRPVQAEKVFIYLRADFPHDNYWTQGELTFSDGSDMLIHLYKTGEAQEFVISPRKITWIKLGKLMYADNPARFPALTQWAVYGWDISSQGNYQEMNKTS